MADSDTDSSNTASIAKSELISRLAGRQTQLSEEDVELAVETILEQMSVGLIDGGRVEIRGFGSMSLHYRPPRIGRNPKTGVKVQVPEKFVPHFKPGTNLRDRVNQSVQG